MSRRAKADARRAPTLTMGRIDWLRAAVALITAAGLGVTVALLDAVGVGDVFAVLRRIGLVGFLLYASYTLVILAILGLAWYLLALGQSRARLWAFIWGRATREAATDVLPFSQFGGIIIGARTVIARGVPQPLVYASLVADQTTELAAQLVYSIYGAAVLALLLWRTPTGGELLILAAGGLGASLAIIMAFAFAQRPMLVLAARISGVLLPGSAAVLTNVRDALDAIYRRRARLLAAFLLHIVAWVGSGAGAWIALHLIGIELSVQSVIVIESLIFTLRTAAFMVPGAIGLQEGAYLLIGPLFGLPPEAALALSLLKRARDLAIGIPAMIVWQIGEARGLTRPRAEVRES